MQWMESMTAAGSRALKWLGAAAVVTLVARVFLTLQAIRAAHPDYPGHTADIVGLLLGGVTLLILTCMPDRARWKAARAIGIGGLLGLIFFIATLGFALADTANIDWLLRGDWAQHFVGWHMYRSAPWRWPPGVFDNFWHPVGTAIIFTDSLPLVAMPLKLFSTLLPMRFQYIGLWLLLNCILQGVFGILLLRCFSPRLSVQVIGAAFLLIAPVFISRIDHDTLTTHWLLLAALWLYFRSFNSTRSALAWWMALSAVSALVHPYLNAMLLAIGLAYYLRVAYVDRSASVRSALLQVAALIATSLFCWWLCGAFTLRPSGGGVALGIYNANLLAWFDPQWMSRWLPNLPSGGNGQYEGKGYLGMGVFLLAAAAMVVSWRRDPARFTPQALGPLVLITLVLTLYAWSTRFTLGSIELIDLTPRHPSVFGVFRGAGRFIWASAYLITLLAVVIVAQRAGRWAVPLLAVALLLQIVDLEPLHSRTRMMRAGESPRAAEPVLHDPGWTEAVQGLQHITLVPPLFCSNEEPVYLPFALLAGDTHMTLNTGYLARWDEKKTGEYCASLQADMAAGKRDASTLYILHPAQIDAFRAISQLPVDCRIMDGYAACRVSGAAVAKPE
jgi:Family of unknown function (DUF6311)